jgi:tetratricopeptide (TPR) repeat protein
MNHDRLQQLFSFLESDPDDAFLIYAIANEYKETQPEEALHYYEKLLTRHPDYVGTYYHAGKLYEDMKHPAKAEEVYRKGLQVSRNAGQMHAFAEIQGALNKLLGLDYEED